MTSSSTVRSRIPATTEGTHDGPFGAAEWTLVGLVGAVWGSSFLFIELALQALHWTVVAAGRLTLGLATLAAVPAARRPVDRADLPRIMLLGAVWMAIPWLLIPLAQQWVASSVAGMLNGAVPVFATILAAVLLRRRPNGTQVAGIGLGFAGVTALAAPSLNAKMAGASPAGIVVLVVAMGCYALAANLAVPLQQRYGALPVVLRVQATALVLVAPAGLLGLRWSQWQPGPVAALVPLGVLAAGIAFVAMTTLVGRVGAARGSIAIYLIPLVATAAGVGLLGETFTPTATAGGLLILAGAWLAGRNNRTSQP